MRKIVLKTNSGSPIKSSVMKKVFLLVFQFATVNAWSQAHERRLPINTSLQNFDVIIQQKNNLTGKGFRNDINIRSVRDFSRSFENATNIAWCISENYLSVSCFSENQQISSYYSKKGVYLFTIKNYCEFELDPLIARWVKKELGLDFSISRVAELDKQDVTFYDINLESCKYCCPVKLIKKRSGDLEKQTENTFLLKD
jgi:hypothetical protein